MSHLPSDLKYLSSHEWLRIESDGTAFIGITDHAQGQMGDLVYVECPEVGIELSAGDEAGVVESVKAASDIYCPIAGEVVAINEKLEDAPELINQDAYGEGWMFQIKISDLSEADDLMSADDYQAQIDAED
jgi:glycine cleavage system H protein